MTKAVIIHTARLLSTDEAMSRQAPRRPRPCRAQCRLVSQDGRVIDRFRKAWRNGKQAVVMEPMTWLSRLAAQVPSPRFHMLSYYEVLAPAAPKRSQIVPGHGGVSRS